jgi:hypothetical protein
MKQDKKSSSKKVNDPIGILDIESKDFWMDALKERGLKPTIENYLKTFVGEDWAQQDLWEQPDWVTDWVYEVE